MIENSIYLSQNTKIRQATYLFAVQYYLMRTEIHADHAAIIHNTNIATHSNDVADTHHDNADDAHNNTENTNLENNDTATITNSNDVADTHHDNTDDVHKNTEDTNLENIFKDLEFSNDMQGDWNIFVLLVTDITQNARSYKNIIHSSINENTKIEDEIIYAILIAYLSTYQVFEYSNTEKLMQDYMHISGLLLNPKHIKFIHALLHKIIDISNIKNDSK